MVIFIILTLLLVIALALVPPKQSMLKQIDERQNYFFDNQQFSTQEFYTLVEVAVKSRNTPNVTFKRVTFSQSGMFSAKREYLRISRFRQVFDIGAAPFGTGFFISYWSGKKEEKGILEFFKGRKTYFQLDTENMYKAIIKAAIDEAIESMATVQKGARMLKDVGKGAESMVTQ